MDLRYFASRGFNFYLGFCETLKGSFISLYKRLIVTINLVSAYTRSDVQVDCVSARELYILTTLVHLAFACE